MKSKKELRKELEDVYFQALIVSILDTNSYISGSIKTKNRLIVNAFETLEKELYGKILSPENSLTKVPFKNALKRYKEIQNSPLAQMMKEEK